MDTTMLTMQPTMILKENLVESRPGCFHLPSTHNRSCRTGHRCSKHPLYCPLPPGQPEGRTGTGSSAPGQDNSDVSVEIVLQNGTQCTFSYSTCQPCCNYCTKTIRSHILLYGGSVVWVHSRTGDRGVVGSNPIGSTLLRNFGNSVYPTLPVSVGGETKSRWSLLPGVNARGSKISHTGSKCVTCHGLHNSEINHSCVSHQIGCLEYTYLRNHK